MSKDTSESTFPYRDEQGDGSYIQHFGLTKREYFAAMAMQGMLADSSFDNPATKVARVAFEMADAMIAEGSK